MMISQLLLVVLQVPIENAKAFQTISSQESGRQTQWMDDISREFISALITKISRQAFQIPLDSLDLQELADVSSNCSDLLLFPSLDEGFGYPLAEAMTVGIPIVASNIEVIREVCKDSAILVEPGLDDVRRGICDALNMKTELVERGLVRSKKFSIQNFSSEILGAYREFLKSS